MAMRPMMPRGGPMGVGAAMDSEETGAPNTALPEDSEETGATESNVTPEEQEIFDTVRARYLNGMYAKGKEKTADGEPSLLDQVHSFFKDAQSEDNPISFIDVLGNVTANTVIVLEDKMEADGVSVPGDVLMHVGMFVLQDLAKFSENAGYHEYTEKELAGASTQAFSIYGEQRKAQGKLDMDAIKGDFDSLMAADKAGTLDDVLPGSAQAAQELRPPEAEGEAVQPPTGIAAANPQPLPPRRL